MGALQDYLKEVRRLVPEDGQPEILTFFASIAPNGTILTQSPSLRVKPGYMFALEQIRAGCPVPPQMTDDESATRLWTLTEFLPYISFNVLNEGRQQPIFKLPLAMNLFVNSCGTTEGQKFSVPFTFFEGADISIEWFVDLVGLLQTLMTNGRTQFNPGYIDVANPEAVKYVEFYAYLIGSLIRAEKIS